jgi:thiomorpholine-carboxylate dehydrogenase
MSNAATASLPYLDDAQARAHLDDGALIAAMKQALISYSAGAVVQPDRQMLEVPERNGFFGAMTAVGDAVGVKLVSFYPGNAARDISTHHATILLFRPETGEPMAIMDGGLITERRTAAVSAVATDVLAIKDASVLAILGTGVQARAHAEILPHVRDFAEIRVWGRDDKKAAALSAEIGARAMSAEEAVRGADVVVTATSAKNPVLSGDWLKPGAHVNAVGWNSSDARELDDAAMGNRVIVESVGGTAKESGNIRGSGASIYAEIGEILSGTKSVDRSATTIFDSVGMAIEDVMAATLVWRSWSNAQMA